MHLSDEPGTPSRNVERSVLEMMIDVNAIDKPGLFPCARFPGRWVCRDIATTPSQSEIPHSTDY